MHGATVLLSSFPSSIFPSILAQHCHPVIQTSGLQFQGLWLGRQHDLTVREIQRTGQIGIFHFTLKGVCSDPSQSSNDELTQRSGWHSQKSLQQTPMKVWKCDLHHRAAFCHEAALIFFPVLLSVFKKKKKTFSTKAKIKVDLSPRCFQIYSKAQWKVCVSVPSVICNKKVHQWRQHQKVEWHETYIYICHVYKQTTPGK